jgi:cytosine/adenosine deaminase-related metal-dependent hydrolase
MHPPDSSWSLSARWVFPVDRPPIEGGVVVIANGRIRAVERRGYCKTDVDLGDYALLPGSVNAHTHLDLSGLRGRIPTQASFLDWLRAVIRHRRERTPDQVDADIHQGIAESIAAGVTLVGDIAGEGLSLPLLSEAPLRSVVFYEILGLSKPRARRAWSAAQAWLAARSATAVCRPGLSPHAPYSVRRSIFRAVIAVARARRVPLCIHLGESKEEMELLEHHVGPLVEFLKELNSWDEAGLTNLSELGRLFRSVPTVALAHCNHLDPTHLPPGSSIVYCPRTHAYFGRPPHPFRDFLPRGVRVALGTDSLASNPNLDLLAEAQFLHGRYPDFPGESLLHMATLAGAEVLGWADETGSLTPGKSADLVAVPLADRAVDNPYHALFQSTGPRIVLFRGSVVSGTLPGERFTSPLNP